MHRAVVLILALVSAAACAGGPGPAGFGPDGVFLRYEMEDAAAVAYTFSDTTRFSIEAGAMGTMSVLSAQAGSADVVFRPGEEGVQATVRLSQYAARFENPSQGATRADEADVRGPWSIRLDHAGRVEVVDTPSLSPAARQIAGSESLVRSFFVHLPGAVAPIGTAWTDTVSLRERTDETVSRALSVIRSTVVGDTMLAGRRLAVIHTVAATDLEVEGSAGGVEVLQRLSGSIRGVVLWDAGRSLLVERTEAGALEGTIELPGLGFGALPVTAEVRRRVAATAQQPPEGAP